MEKKNKVQNDSQAEEEEADKMMEICSDLYEKATSENRLADLETICSIVRRFGENGYASVDSKNQTDMEGAGQVSLFCEMADAKKEAELIIMQVAYSGGFIKFDFHAKDGKVDVVRTNFDYKDGKLQNGFKASYPARNWKYTKDGYFMFSGSYDSEQLYALTLSDAEEHVALRVQPLDEKCRELNQRYILPVSYERNNIFLFDWNEKDFGQLDFYDLYDIFYPNIYGQPVPYVADDHLGVGAVYQIPKEEFENVIMTHIKIDSDTLQAKTTYNPESATYEYKPRGFYEIEYPEYPYPEVVGFTENNDGTITLRVHAVFPYKGVSKAYAHETVVRPLENGGVQYVSNKIIPSGDNLEETWYTPRLTEGEWNKIYGGE